MMQKSFLALCAIFSCALVCVAQPPNGGGPPGGFGRENNESLYTGPLTNYVSITTNGAFRVIKANGIPDHPPGQFPNANNPNSLSPQHYEYKMPLHPQYAARVTYLRMQPFGVALNGVVFDPFAAEWWNRDQSSGFQYEPHNIPGQLGLDQYNAHVQPNGAYHYHGIPVGLLDKVSHGQSKMALLGWAADGFPMYGPWGYTNPKDPASPLKKLKPSYRIRQGSRQGGPGGKYDGTFLVDYEYVKGLGDLDECNARFGPTPEFPTGTYYYVLTDQYPYIPRIFRGTPDKSFERRGPPGGGGPGGRRGGGQGIGPGGQGGGPGGQSNQGGPPGGGPQGRRNGPPQQQGNNSDDSSRPPGPPPDNQ